MSDKTMTKADVLRVIYVAVNQANRIADDHPGSAVLQKHAAEVAQALDAVTALIAENKRLSAADDPQWEGTDGAHPAWWRDEQYGAESIVRAVSRVLDGLDDGAGVSREPWESVRRRLMALVAERDALLTVRETLKRECEALKADRGVLRDALELIAAPLVADGVNHMADVYRARAALSGAGGAALSRHASA